MASVINRGTKSEPVWYAKYKDSDGKHKRVNTKQTTKEAAKRFAAELEARVARGLVGFPEPPKPQAPPKTLTVNDLCDDFLKNYSRPKIINIEGYRAHMSCVAKKQLRPYALATCAAVAVSKADVETWRDLLQREAKYAPNTVNMALQFLRTVYNWAGKHGKVTCRNPCSEVERCPRTPNEEHYTIAEVHSLVALPACPPPVWQTLYKGAELGLTWACVRTMVWCALYTGMRKGELLGLTWACVRLDGELPRIEVKKSYNGPTKSRKPRTIPVHLELLSQLRAWQEQCPATPEGLVFPIPLQDAAHNLLGWRMGRRKDMAGIIEVLTFAGCHIPTVASQRQGPQERAWLAFRHTFATHFMEATGNGDAQSKLLGHSQGRGRSASGGADISMGYTHTGLAYLARELAKMTLLPYAPAPTPPRKHKRPQAQPFAAASA